MSLPKWLHAGVADGGTPNRGPLLQDSKITADVRSGGAKLSVSESKHIVV